MLDKTSQSDITTSSKSPAEAIESQGIIAVALQALSAIYASAAKVTLEGFEDLADRRAERRAERLGRGAAPRVAVSDGRSVRQPTVLSAAKRASKSR
jgi:hypothetical protein